MNRLTSSANMIALLALSLLLPACATQPPSTATAAPAAKPAPRAAPAVTGTRGRPEFPGFRRVVRNDTEYFCQASTPTGSRTRRGDQCYTRDELKRMEETNRDVFKDAAGGSSHDTLKMDPAR